MIDELALSDLRDFFGGYFHVDLVDWTALWQDPVTGELWKEHYPHGEMHGGGPPEFIAITEEQAVEEIGPIRSRS